MYHILSAPPLTCNSQLPNSFSPMHGDHIPSTSVLWSLGCSSTSKRRQWRQPHWLAVVVFVCKFFTAHAFPAPLLACQLGYALLNRIIQPLLTHQTTDTQTGRENSAPSEVLCRWEKLASTIGYSTFLHPGTLSGHTLIRHCYLSDAHSPFFGYSPPPAIQTAFSTDQLVFQCFWPRF